MRICLVGLFVRVCMIVCVVAYCVCVVCLRVVAWRRMSCCCVDLYVFVRDVC